MKEVGRPDGDRNSLFDVDEAVNLFLSVLSTITCARKEYGRLVIIRERRQENHATVWIHYILLLF